MLTHFYFKLKWVKKIILVLFDIKQFGNLDCLNTHFILNNSDLKGS